MFEMSQPVERLSVWGKKQRGKGREMRGGGVRGGEGGVGGGLLLLPSSTLDQRPVHRLEMARNTVLCWIFKAVR